jgi:D-alanyl-D-alanine carboxypeptidase
VLVIIFTKLPSINSSNFLPETSTDEENFSESVAAQTNIPLPTIQASAAVVWDKNSNTFLFNKNGNKSLPIASITKLLTAVIALENIPSDHLVEITSEDLQTEGGAGHLLGEEWSRDDLVAYTLMVSSNDGSSALLRTSAELAGIDQIELLNQTSKKIGLVDSSWQNASGLDIVDGQVPSNKASATDVIRLLDYASRNFPSTTMLTGDTYHTFSSSKKTYQATSTNELSNVLPHTIAAKTGYTIVAGGNLVVMAEAGLARPLYIVVLDSTADERFSDAEKLYNYSVELIQS